MIPNKIYLQVEDEFGDEPLDVGDEITWCVDQINESDLVYVAESELKRATELMPCGHPPGCVVSDGGGASHCGWCEAVAQREDFIKWLEAERDDLRKKLAAAEGLAEALQDAVDSANNKTATGLWQRLEEHIAIEWDTKGAIALADWNAANE